MALPSQPCSGRGGGGSSAGAGNAGPGAAAPRPGSSASYPPSCQVDELLTLQAKAMTAEPKGAAMGTLELYQVGAAFAGGWGGYV